MQSHLRVFTEFCHNLGFPSFPVQAHTILHYIAFLLLQVGLTHHPKPYLVLSIVIVCSVPPPPGDKLYSFQLVYVGVTFFGGDLSMQSLWFLCLTSVSQFRQLFKLCF